MFLYPEHNSLYYNRRGHGSQRSILSDSTFDYYNTGSSDGRMHSGTYPRQKPAAELHNGTYPLRYRGSTMQQDESSQVGHFLLFVVTTGYHETVVCTLVETRYTLDVFFKCWHHNSWQDLTADKCRTIVEIYQYVHLQFKVQQKSTFPLSISGKNELHMCLRKHRFLCIVL